jgi:hypothetical protein
MSRIYVLLEILPQQEVLSILIISHIKIKNPDISNSSLLVAQKSASFNNLLASCHFLISWRGLTTSQPTNPHKRLHTMSLLSFFGQEIKAGKPTPVAIPDGVILHISHV